MRLSLRSGLVMGLMAATPMRRTMVVVALMALAMVEAAVAHADEATFAGCSEGTVERLRFVEQRLDQRRSYAGWWWKGWTGFYGIGMVVESVQAGTEDDGGKRADYIVSAAKAGFGVGRLLLYPPTAKEGADAMRVIAPSDEAACRERLRVGEELLRTNAKESASRWSWKRHAANVAINVAGGLIVAEGFDESRGWRSAGIGIAVGEAMTFSHPWKADDDLVEYEQRFGTNPDLAPRPVSWTVAPRLGGLQLLVTF
jgi:hypothetical protein